MPMLSLLVSLGLQSEIIGWTCSAERTVDGRVYRSRRSIEGEHRYPGHFRISWPSGFRDAEPFVEWIEGRPPDAPRTINFSVPLSRRASRAYLRIILPDGAERSVPNSPAIWHVSTRPTGIGHFQSLEPDLNRQLWAAGSFRTVVEDRRGRVVGMRDISLPDPAEAVRLAAELDRQVDEKLRDPANPEMSCESYGSEAYVDPA